MTPVGHQNWKFTGGAGQGDLEVIRQHAAAADPWSDRRVDLFAVFCGLAGDERDGPRHQAKQRECSTRWVVDIS